MTAKTLLEFFDGYRERGDPLALVTVIATRGSTYSKVGSQMLINGEGVFRGMLSGGCLEGDLAVRAAVVIETGRTQVVDYNLAADDELWGLGVGCDGTMRVQLQAITAGGDYVPFAAIADVLRGFRPADISLPVDDAEAGEVVFRVVPPIRLLILGAGLDARPVASIAAELGWRCTVYDHRPAYVESGAFGGAEAVLCRPAEELAQALSLDDFDAAIVMSHHLVSDRHYLEQLARSRVPYVGLLGPVGRRRRLLEELGPAGKDLDSRLHGPAGLDLGGRGPGPIALAIIAEIQQILATR